MSDRNQKCDEQHLAKHANHRDVHEIQETIELFLSTKKHSDFYNTMLMRKVEHLESKFNYLDGTQLFQKWSKAQP